MKSASHFAVKSGWRILLHDLGIRPADVLRRAGLPDDLFGRAKARLTTEQYFRLWRGLEETSDDPALPLRIGAAISVESFDPPVFAALCSPDLNTALERIARYKPLVMPMALEVAVGAATTTLELEWLGTIAEPPDSLVATELVFFTQLARIATRAEVRPVEVCAPHPPAPTERYTGYFGVEVRHASTAAISFKAADARLPFLTADERMWRFFEPELQKQLCDLDDGASMSDRVRGALLELLPVGRGSVEAVSSKLAVSPRTLQRRLRDEGGSFKAVLRTTREQLAHHYLTQSSMTGAEISFLLGFEDPNSFFRAYRGWTGETPSHTRTASSAPR